MASDADMEDYGFEYSDEEQEEQDVDIENQYYNSKGLVETDPEGALSGFAEVVGMEQDKAEWGFKALKQTVKLYYRLGRYKEMMEAYREMLTYIKSAVTRNYSEKCINSIMDYVSGSASQNFSLLQEFYQTTLRALEEAKNERLWFKTNLKLCKIFFDIGEYGRMSKILKELHKSCQREDGTDDHKKGTQLLEVYAIEIQMYTETKNNKKLKQLYQKALTIKSAIPHPRIMGIIHECGGKMHMAERQVDTKLLNLHCQMLNEGRSSKKRRLLHHDLYMNWNSDDNVLVDYKPKRKVKNLLFASSDDSVTVNSEFQSQGSDTDATDLEKMRVKLNRPLVDDVDFCDRLLQSLYDAARVFELEIKEENSLSRVSLFSTVWFGVDQNAWEKTLSYQAAVYSLLQAASEFSSQSDERDKNVNVFVQRSLLRLSALLESLIREKLSAKQPKAYDWFWSKQVPAVVASFIKKIEGFEKNMCGGLSCTSEVSLLMLALTCIAAITKVGPTKLSCSQFFSMSTEITGSLMDMLVGLIPISQVYSFVRDAGLCREFLVHFGPRAAACRGKVEQGSQEVIFWVYIAQRQLQKAIDKERIWSRLTTSESIEVLEKDLAIFGFFIALGRSTRSYLLSNGFNSLDDQVEDFIRHLIVGSVLYYPELSSISSYQLYVEVVCEELDWLPFYPGITSTTKQLHMHKSKQEGSPNAETVPQALDICSDWIQSFIKYSTWLESPSNVKAARYLSIGRKKLSECMEVRLLKDKTLEISANKTVERSAVERLVSDTFDEALKSVEEVVLRLENLLQELYASSASSGKEHLKAAYSVLEKIQKLEKEAKFLEASFSAKEDSLQEESVLMDDCARYSDDAGDQMVQVQKEGNIIKKSLSKLKETGTDVWQGTQLLAIDAAAAMGLLRRILMRDELTDREKKTLKRTLTDMASVIPIGILMLLPVTAVGHAAMLAAIKKYVPAMIPSTYSPERLDILRQLEKMKQMTACDLGSDEEVNEVN